MRKRWNIQKHDYSEVGRLAKELGVAPIIAALLISRGLGEAELAHKFLNPAFDQIHDPYQMLGIEQAVARILKAIEQNEKILVWGDYDVDGTTGTIVLRKALELVGAQTGFHVPHRFKEGYGLNRAELERARQENYKLVISVDCGITAFEPIKWAQENNLEVIVTDHHLPSSEGLPPALAVVNPNQTACEYPDKNLAGVGVAFKLAHALLRAKGREHLVPGFLKVVAIGTIADLMHLTGENRTIVALGLKDLPNAKNYGLRALMEVAGCTREMTAYDIGFRLAPRINAAGRMDAARTVVELFEANDFEKARLLAFDLDARNRERQEMQRRITDLAVRQAAAKADADASHFVVVAGEHWHRGVIGLAASKIAEKLHRPVIVISLEDNYGHGSARSIKPYHLLNGLESYRELFEQFGGHAQAAGMRIKNENIESLRDKLNAHARACLTHEDLIPEINVDAVISTKSLGQELVHQIKSLEPFGSGNPKPIFVTKNLVLTSEPLVMKEKHLKLRLADKERNQFEAVWWNGVEQADGLSLRSQKILDVVYTPEINTWNNNRRLQLSVHDVNIAE